MPEQNFKRLRRLRKFPWSRNLLEENNLSTKDFILAVFITDGENIEQELESMPEVFIYSIDRLIIKLKNYEALGLNAVMLFPKTSQNKKSKNAEESYNENNLTCRAIKEIKKHLPNLGVISDIALDPYTLDGHDGITDESGYVLNDETVEILCKQALNFAKAGCDIVAPSDMMDGRIKLIREFLDKNEFIDVQIMAYSVKFCSSFYEPFRSSVGSKQSKPIDKSTYQINYANSNEALREVEEDIREGADYVIIKPGLLYLDILRRVKDKFKTPLVIYNVSGEYALIMLGIKNGLFERKKVFYELYISMKRAGADIIIGYNFDLILDLTKNYN
jgi:porphobilinogen synthase